MKCFKFNIIAASAAAIALFSACDNIPEDERFIENPRPTVERKILIYEFTGQRCTNCPDGAQAVHNLQEAYPGQVLAVNLHPENTQYTIPLGNLVLTSPEATFIYNYYRPSAFPAACIDGAAPLYNIPQWSTDAITALGQPSPAALDLSTSYNEETRELTVDYNVNFNEYTTTETLLQLYVVEDGIVGIQIINGRPERDYVHNHVLRTAFFEEWGLSLGSLFAIDTPITGSKTIKLDESWDAANCQVVGCLVSAGDKSVLQANDAPVIKESTEIEK